MSSEVAILGDEAIVSAWRLLGLDVYSIIDEVNPKVNWEAVLKGDYKIIYILDKWAGLLKREIDSLAESPWPVVVVVPGPSGATTFFEEIFKGISLRAVGTDIKGENK